MTRNESQSGEGHQAHAGPLDGLPEGIVCRLTHRRPALPREGWFPR